MLQLNPYYNLPRSPLTKKWNLCKKKIFEKQWTGHHGVINKTQLLEAARTAFGLVQHGH